MNNLKNIAIAKIKVNPFQPRHEFDEKKLQDLTASIKQYGVLQPLLVVPDGGEYILLAGERRLRASKLAGLTEVPCVLGEYDDRQKAEIALIENLQRADLHYLEEAVGMRRLLEEFHLTQEDLAEHLGIKQSTLANKLRILKMDEQVLADLFKSNLTERHARALLKVEDGRRLKVLQYVIKHNLNVKQTEEYIGKLNMPRKSTHRLIVSNDLRLYINSFKKVVDVMNKGGVKTDFKYAVDGDDVVVTIKFSNKKK